VDEVGDVLATSVATVVVNASGAFVAGDAGTTVREVAGEVSCDVTGDAPPYIAPA
jgi:hypothetical protein